MQTVHRISRWILPSLIMVLVVFGCSSEDTVTEPSTPAFSGEEIQEMIVLPQEEKDEVLVGLLTSGVDTTAAMDSVRVLFLQDENVEWAEVGPQGIAVAYKNGLMGGIFLDPKDNAESLNSTYCVQPGQAVSRSKSSGEKTDKNAIFLNPSYFEREQWADQIMDNYGEHLEGAGYSPLEVYLNDEVSLAVLKELTGHRIVHFYSHGWAWPNENDISQVYLMTGQDYHVGLYAVHWRDIDEGDVTSVKISNGSTKYFVTPDYIQRHNRLEEDTVVYGGFCYSDLGGWPSLMVHHEGVGGYFGFDWSVWTTENASWNVNLMESLLDSEASPRTTANGWMHNDIQKYYLLPDRAVHINYTGNPNFTLYDRESIPCNETLETHDDVYVKARVTVYNGTVPADDAAVRIDYRKVYCDGHESGIDPVYGETQSAGVYVCQTTGVFHLNNTQDYILVRATVGSMVQERIFSFEAFNGLDGSGLFFPMEAGFFFQF